MPAKIDASPMSFAALAYVQAGVTAPDLVARFAAAETAISQDTAESLLVGLVRLGLAYVAHASDAGDHYRTAPLGERLLAASLAGNLDHPDLLADIERMRTDIVSTIAHELRTPITAIRTSVGLLLDPTVQTSPDERRMLLETLDRNATRMQRVVGDIVDLTRFRAGRIQLQLRRFDAADVARSAIDSMSALAGTRAQTIELQVPPDPLWVFADFRRIEQALVNLISNAMKYSPRGSSIEVSVSPSGPDVSWAVTDKGYGIEPADQARLFERFFVADGGRPGTTGGIGLGLPISLSIVEAHDGSIDVTSRRGQGSSFRITVPVHGPKEGPNE